MCGIYKIENLINGKIYIGKSVNIEKRFRSHITDSFNKNKPEYNHLIHRAIRKYGTDNFSFEIIEQCKENELNKREIYWISFYDCCILDSKNKGYNMTRGGDGSSYIDTKKIYELWDHGFTITEIADMLHHDRHCVALRLKEYENYTSEEGKTRKYDAVRKAQQRAVCQYDLHGNFINEYESIEEASRKTGVGYRSICSNVQGKTRSAGGFQWTYKDAPPPGVYNVKGNGYNVPVVQLDLQYHFVNEFQKLSDASKAIGLTSSSTLSWAIQDPSRIVKDHHWMRKEDYELFLLKNQSFH